MNPAKRERIAVPEDANAALLELLAQFVARGSEIRIDKARE